MSSENQSSITSAGVIVGLGGHNVKPKKMSEQMDCASFRSLMAGMYNEHIKAAAIADGCGEPEKARYLRGVADGIEIAWRQQLELERLGPCDE